MRGPVIAIGLALYASHTWKARLKVMMSWRGLIIADREESVELAPQNRSGCTYVPENLPSITVMMAGILSCTVLRGLAQEG